MFFIDSWPQVVCAFVMLVILLARRASRADKRPCLHDEMMESVSIVPELTPEIASFFERISANYLEVEDGEPLPEEVLKGMALSFAAAELKVGEQQFSREWDLLVVPRRGVKKQEYDMYVRLRALRAA
ncbi:MAG: hypothetical protein V4674_02565 [Patescibacteria group bacterium]